MTSHRFGIGEGVTYSEKRFPTGLWIAELIVIEQLTRDGEPEYRLRVQGGATEYVLAEHELSPSSDKRNDHPAWHGLDEDDPAACREALGEKFPKLPFHKIVCIGALIAERRDGVWTVLSLGAPHIGERREAEMIQAFVDRIAEFRPQMVTFNGSSFDLPVLRYRAMINRVSAPGLECRRYWYRYSDDCLDLCDALACYSAGGKVSLSELGRAWVSPEARWYGWLRGRPLRPGGAARGSGWLLRTDVISTYRIWLVYELFWDYHEGRVRCERDEPAGVCH